MATDVHEVDLRFVKEEMIMRRRELKPCGEGWALMTGLISSSIGTVSPIIADC